MTAVPVPEAIELERALLGCAIVDPGLVRVIDLPGEDIYLERHRVVWEALVEMDRAGRQADYVTLVDYLEASGRLEIAGGPAALTGLVADTPFGGDPAEYAGVIRDRADRRRAVQLAQNLAKAAFDLDGDFERARGEAIDSLARGSAGAGKIVHISDVAGRLYDEIEERAKDPKEIYGLDTGFQDFNRQTAGLQVGMNLLSGDPGVGKTVFGVQMGAQMAEAGAPGIIFELEMHNVALVRRILAARTGISPRCMRSGNISDDQWPVLTYELECIAHLPLWMSDDTSWTTASLRSAMIRMKSLHGAQWFLLDYMTLLGDSYGNDETERTAYVSKSLRRMCKDLQLAGLVIHTQNKAGVAERGPKNLAGLGGAVGVIYDADMVMFLSNHLLSQEEQNLGEKPKPNVRTLTFGKFREDNPKRLMHLVFKPGDVPAFADYLPEANAQRIPANGRRG